MRLYISEKLQNLFNSKKRIDIDVMFRVEDIRILRCFDSIPGEIMLEFSEDEFQLIAEVYTIVERLRQEREHLASKIIVFPGAFLPDPPKQLDIPFWKNLQRTLFG